MRTPKFRNRLTGFEPLEDRQLLSVTTILNDFNNATIHDIHTVTGSNTQGGLQYESSAAKPGARVALITDAEFRASEADPLTLSATVVIPSDDSVYLLVRADGTTAANGYHSQNEVQLYVSTSSIDIIESQNGNKVTLASLPVSLPSGVPLCIEAHDNGTTVTISIPDHNVTLSATPTGTYPHAYAGLRTWAGHSRIDDFFLQYGKEEEEQQPQQSQQQEEAEEEHVNDPQFSNQFFNTLSSNIPIITGSTEDNILASYNDKVAELQSRLTSLQQYREQIDAAHAGANARLHIVDAIIAETDALLAKEEYRLKVEAGEIGPKIHIDVPNSRVVNISYSDMPDGIYALLYRDAALTNTVPVPAGSGTVQLYPYSMALYRVEMVDASGTVVSDPYIFRVKFRGALEKPATGADQMLHVAIEAPEPIDPALLAKEIAEKADAQGERESLLHTIEELEEEQQESDAVAALLHREQLPYSRLYVEIAKVDSNEVVLHVRVQSPLQSVRVELTDEPSHAMQNASGIDQTITMIRHRDPNYGNQKPLALRMYDAEDNTLLDTVFVAYNQYAPSATILTAQTEWKHVETGVLKEYAITPTIGIVNVQGPNVLVYYATPYDQSTVMIGTGGILGEFSAQHATGTKSGLASLTINSDKPTGNYTINLYAKEWGQVIASASVHWDRDCRMLSLSGGQPLWSAADIVLHQMPPEPEFAPAADMTSSIGNAIDEEAKIVSIERVVQQEMQDMQPFTIQLNEWNLRQAYKEELALHSPFFVDRDTWVISRMTVKPEDFQAHVDALHALDPNTNRATIEYGERQKMLAEMDDLNKRYNWAMEDLQNILIEGEQIMISLREGTYSRDRMDAFRVTVTQNAELLHGYSHEEIVRLSAALNTNASMRTVSERLQASQKHVDDKAEQAFVRHIKDMEARAINSSNSLQLAYEVAVLAGKSVSVEEGLANMARIEGQTRATIADARAQSAAELAASPKMQRLQARIERVLTTSSDPRVVALRESGSVNYATVAQNIIASTVELADARNLTVAQTDIDAASTDEKILHGVAFADALDHILAPGYTVKNLGVVDSQGVPDVQQLQQVNLLPGGIAAITFELPNAQMVNLWAQPLDAGFIYGGFSMPASVNLALKLEGGNSQSHVSYASNHAGDDGESISSILPAEKYTLTVRDVTDYSSLTSAQRAAVRLPTNIPIHIESAKYNTAKIEGRISVEGRSAVMPVSMSVAEFNKVGDSFERNEKYGVPFEDGGVNKLDPTKPVWVVVHGKDSSEQSEIMQQLTLSLFENSQDEDFQIVTVDWNEAAKDGVFIQDAPWAEGVGKWTANQLLANGFSPSQINTAGWSHGSYVAFEMGRELQRVTGNSLHSIVALDAAQNIPVLSGYDHSAVNFANVAQRSLAIDSSLVAGSNSLAATADRSFQLHLSAGVNINALTRHKLAVTAFAAILNKEHGSSGPFTDHFSLQYLMGKEDTLPSYTNDSYNETFEGFIDIDIDGVQALPQQLRYRDSSTGQEQVVSFHSVYA